MQKIIEGTFNKGGRNKSPSCPRPSAPPKGQNGRKKILIRRQK